MKSIEPEVLVFHLANQYLRDLLPKEHLIALEKHFSAAEQKVNEQSEALSWSKRVIWSSHWDGLLTNNVQQESIANTLSSALMQNRQVLIHYQGKDEPFQFNLFGLIKRDQNLLVVGSYWNNKDPYVLAIRKILAIEVTNYSAIQPKSDFDLSVFVHTELNFPHSQQKLSLLQIEFSVELYSYIRDHTIDAEHTMIIPPADYHHEGYFLLNAKGVTDGERLRQWIRGFGNKAQVLKPNDLRLVMEQARLDMRTNLLTATEFKRCMNREIQRCLRNRLMSFVILILDLDHFKQINDQNGHDFGDTVLLQVANCIREYDEAARHGGEEFSILLPNTSLAEGSIIAERIRRHIEQQKLINHQGNIVPVTASIGLAVYPDNLPSSLKTLHNDNIDESKRTESMAQAIFHQADQALYQAKELGRNRVCHAIINAAVEQPC